MPANAYTGTALNVQWVTSAATATLSSSYTTFSETPNIDLFEQTGGSDTDKLYTVGQRAYNYSVTFYIQAGTNTPGTAQVANMSPGQIGTLIWSPEGTVAGKAKFTIPAICTGASIEEAYNGNTTVTATFQSNGARTAGTN